MPTLFTPVENLNLYCRFCKKITAMQLDRSIAEAGKTVDKKSTFEFCCSKCLKTVCFNGNDLMAVDDIPEDTREYSPKEHFFLGEEIFHKKFKEKGVVVGNESGNSNRILVQFEKAGVVKLIQDL